MLTICISFKDGAQNLPLRRVGRGEISPLAVPRDKKKKLDSDK
jgi:hypothetical protein